VKISSMCVMFVVVCTHFSVWAGMAHAQSWQHRQVEILLENKNIKRELENKLKNENEEILRQRAYEILVANLSFAEAVSVFMDEALITQLTNQNEISDEDIKRLNDARKRVKLQREVMAWISYTKALEKAGIVGDWNLPITEMSKRLLDAGVGKFAIRLAIERKGFDALESAMSAANEWVPLSPQRDIAAALLVILDGESTELCSGYDLAFLPSGEELVIEALNNIDIEVVAQEDIREVIRRDPAFKTFMMDCMFRTINFEDKEKVMDIATKIWEVDSSQNAATMPDGSPLTALHIAATILLNSGKAEIEYSGPDAIARGQERLLPFLANCGFLDGCVVEYDDFRRGSKQ